ncbi:MAG: hypothetical protein CMI74_06620 [Candidatus Pelagibacter sp.]|nr:hypothetical protein [Candidatus Pelagibacter sp.]|tara:strand:- start:12011 stop:12238 length:228 start_codon:yes stop_codon:yes gene_type:complete
MINKIINFLKYYKPSREWRLPFLLLVSTIPPTLLTHFACVKYGISIGVAIGFFGSIPIVIYTCWKIFMDDWLEDD